MRSFEARIKEPRGPLDDQRVRLPRPEEARRLNKEFTIIGFTLFSHVTSDHVVTPWPSQESLSSRGAMQVGMDRTVVFGGLNPKHFGRKFRRSSSGETVCA